MAPRLVPVQVSGPADGEWVRARYLAEGHEIAARYAAWEIMGPPEIRNVDPEARHFNPHRSPIGNLGPLIEIAGWKPSRRVIVAGVAS